MLFIAKLLKNPQTTMEYADKHKLSPDEKGISCRGEGFSGD